MNILFCYDKTYSRKNGGIAAVSLSLMRGFQRNGHICYMLSALQDCVSDCEEQMYLPHQSIAVDEEDNRSMFRSFLRTQKIDVIINQNGSNPYSVWPLVWSKDICVKILTAYHTDFTSLWRCQNRRWGENSIVKLLHIYPLFDILLSYYFRNKYRNLLKQHYALSDKVVFLSDKFFSGYQWFSGIPVDKKFAAIHNPIDKEFTDEKITLKKENEVLFVGRISDEKGVDLLLDVWKRIENSYPNWKLNVVGDGNLKNAMQAYAKELGLRRVFFKGFTNPIDFYRRSKIICLTSKTEGFAVVLVEGMSCGCVPVAFNSYACASDIIDDKVNGFLIQPFNIDKYSACISSLMDDENMRLKIAQSAKEKSLLFSLDNIVRQWVSLFEK